MSKRVSALEINHHFQQRAKRNLILANSLLVSADLGEMAAGMRIIVRSVGHEIKHSAQQDDALLASLRLWMHTTPDLRSAEIFEGLQVNLHRFRGQRS